MSVTAPTPFALQGPLPSGVTVLEASAGTGKTYAIAALATRYVAGGVPLEKILLVTFTRSATGELRSRVRERLVETERALAIALRGGTVDPADDVASLLAAGSPDDVRRRHAHLARALATFDAGTITTTHGFCQEMLAGLGVSADFDSGAQHADDVTTLLSEVVDDLFLRRFVNQEVPDIDRAEAGLVAREVVANPGLRLLPEDLDAEGRAAMRGRLARRVETELEWRKRRLGIITYDDLLTRLNGSLADGPDGVAATKLRERFDVVLVDEFQDTDTLQWQILQRAFGDGRTTLVLIGDPKQAIYAFRGADVYAYLDAASTATTEHTLGVNWRSDAGLLEAYDALFADAQLGHPRIVYRRVAAADGHRDRLEGAPDDSPLCLRVVRCGEPRIDHTLKGYPRAASAREYVADDLADDVVATLASSAHLIDRGPDGSERSRRPIRPGDIAVLVRSNRQATLVRDALADVGVPAVINGAGSVLATAGAEHWLRLLAALEQPQSARRAHAVALTPFVGWDVERLAAASVEDWEQVHRRLHFWARVLRDNGVAALVETIMRAEGLPDRVLAASDGERVLTDLRHVAQLLHEAAVHEHLGSTALASWLRERITEADRDGGNEERTRRLETDEQAIQVLTIHRSKGLEFPVVYCPFLWDPGWSPDRAEPVCFHDPEAGDQRTIDVSLEGDDYEGHRLQHHEEDQGEELRLMYVALTRARHQAVIWWAPTENAQASPLGRLLFSRAADGSVATDGSGIITEEQGAERFAQLGAETPGRISVTHAVLGLPRRWTGDLDDEQTLAASTFDRPLDRRWRRTSYTDLTAGSHDAHVASEPEEPMLDDEPATGESSGAAASEGADAAELRAVPSLLADMPGGREIGTFVHRALELADFDAADLDAELTGRIEECLAWRRVDIGVPEAAVTGLRAAIETPLGPLVGDVRLADIARSDRLDEMTFELPLAGGDTPSGELTPGAIAALLREHLPADDPLLPYADRLEDPALRGAVHGYLTGSLDLVIRLPDGRFAIADYKTNWLGAADEDLSAWHHRPAALRAEMERAHYWLQALLYTVALHRYLRWRAPGYAPDTHLAGVLYLFVRGMTGADTPRVVGVPCGVMGWRPPGALVEALSDLLDTGVST